MTGSSIAHYRILRPIGQGGMGEVYLALDTRLEREVALKVLPEAFARDPDRIQRFRREARLLAALNHPNIAAIYAFEEAEGNSILVLEYVPGDTLEERIRDSVSSIEENLCMAQQMAGAFEYAHDKGVIHRDLKPANVKVTPEGTIKVLDYGLAKAFSDDVSTPGMQTPMNDSEAPTVTMDMTQRGMILGTPAYMSPEQARGLPVGFRTDVWAFGCVLFEMLSGTQAFRGNTAVDIIAAVITSIPDWNALPEDTPPPLRDLLQRCLEKDELVRPEQGRDIRAVIDQILAETATPTTVQIDASAAQTPAEIPNNLPIQLTSFVGREQENRQIAELFDEAQVRLVTITGPGGIGKTRLSVQTGNTLLSRFPDGVWFLALDTIMDARYVITEIAAELGVPPDPAKDPKRQMIEYLADKQLLLILDNFEHLMDAAPIVGELLRGSRTLCCLVTSQEALQIAGERLLALTPLSMPPQGTRDVEALTRYDSVRLFMERVHTVKPDFELTRENADTVAAICHRLDGLPLALELAAARMRGMAVVGWFNWIFTPVLSETPYLSGVYRIDDLAVSINNGLGLTMAPLRFHAPAEVTMIRLKREI